MAHETLVGPTSEVGPGRVVGAEGWAVGNAGGTYFAVSRRCRHLGADLAKGSIDDEGCLVCPWHSRATTSRLDAWCEGRRGSSPRSPASEPANKLLTRVLPLRRAKIEERDGTLYVG